MKTTRSKNHIRGICTPVVLIMAGMVCRAGGDLSLPYYGETSVFDKAFWLSNAYSGAGASYGGFFYAAGQESRGLFGQSGGANGSGVRGWAKDSGNGVNYGGHFCSTGMRGIGVYGWAEATGDVENYGGYFWAQGQRGVGLRAKGGPDGCAGRFEGDIRITGPGEGIVFPDGTKQTTAASGSGTGGFACFAKPAYDSGWIDMPKTGSSFSYTTTLTHNLCGNSDDYVVDLQRRMVGYGTDSLQDGGIGDAFYYSNLTTTSIQVTGPISPKSGTISLRVRIWVSNCRCGCAGVCCGFSPGNRVVLVTDNYQYKGLRAGMQGTVICCQSKPYDPTGLGLVLYAELLVSWDNWTNGVNPDSSCDCSPPPHVPNSCWPVFCYDVRKAD